MNKLLVPEFLLNFSCIGSQCEDTCCQEWGIDIDKNTYYTYKKSKNMLLNEKFNSNIELNNKSTNESNYAKIILDVNKMCAFLNNDKLCSIHSELGHDALCYTCKIYPRIFNRVGDSYEESLFLSCPEVARVALLNRDKMSFTEIDMNLTFQAFITNQAVKNEDIFWLVREFIIDLLQNRNFHLWERLAILGVFIEQCSGQINEQNKNALVSTINSFSMILSINDVHSILNSYKKDSKNQFNFTVMIDSLRGRSIQNEVFKSFMKDFYEGMTEEADTGLTNSIKYNENYECYYKEFVKNHEYILENYLVHYVFTKLFPFSNKHNLFDEYCILAFNYILIKTYLIGISGKYKRIDENLAIKLIHSYERAYNHGDKIIEIAYDELKQKGTVTLENMILLLKD
ncbi:flagellin lysine-N-methylase [Clostridium sp. UBA4548]|uniref:flagellin lysine-N-methylase n=1 Tax=Clostridium sp. UBA4548 TaxID=1946361 RepID=UPI0025BDF657|nr:flagellin lysine-N-methylase [Clostridium sp. UBA4548]